jgi:hypothetical protein
MASAAVIQEAYVQGISTRSLDQVDFGALARRLAQNGVQKKLTPLWIGRCLKQLAAFCRAQSGLELAPCELTQ